MLNLYFFRMNKLVLPVTWLFGVVFLLVGVLGFVTASPLLGFFDVDPVHNVIHLVSGVLAFICAGMGYGAARGFLIVFGIVYGLVTLLGFLNGGNVLGLIQVNQADNYLHLGITVGTLLFGLGSSSQE